MVGGGPVTAAVIGYGLCAIAFLLVTAAGVYGRLAGRQKALLAFGCLATSAWAVANAASPALHSLVPPALELMRTFAWCAFVATLLGSGQRQIVVAVAAAAAATATAMAFGAVGAEHLQVLASVLGLLLLENIYRNSRPDGRWGLKPLCLGLAVIFVFDFFLHANGILSHGIDDRYVASRGFVDTLAAPLLLLAVARGRAWPNNIRLSPQLMFHSAVLIASGAYLLAMGLAGAVLRSLGEIWGPVIQTVFLAGGLVALLLAVASATLRSALRLFIHKHFFRHRYDYRQVWLKFIRQMSDAGQGSDLHARTLRAVADLVDSPEGALWTRSAEDEAFFPTASWSFGEALPAVPTSDPFVDFLADKGSLVDIEVERAAPQPQLPDWLLGHRRAWLVLPLIHQRQLQGFLVLAAPRSHRDIGWEEEDLLKTVGAQAASYLAEEQASRALAEARRLEDFNRRFAFVVHDIKNVVGQMALLVENAERHGDKPEFQRDMLATVTNSVGRMRGLLAQLGAQRDRPPAGPLPPIDLGALVQRLGDSWRSSSPSLAVIDCGQPVWGVGQAEPLEAALSHLIHNAIEACGKAGRVTLAVKQEGSEAVVEVRDDGPGMAGDFVRNHLFRPLDSDKAQGFGIGAFQARVLVRNMGGRLDVDSAPGKGTAMRICLPAQTRQFQGGTAA
jgi:putative PEP-CTERM system histidine kinase